MLWASILLAALAAQLTAAGSTLAESGAEPAYRLRRTLAANTPVTTPREAVQLALADVHALAPYEQPLVRYVWAPDWIERDNAFAQVALVANSTISRTSNLIQPTAIAQGRLLRLELLKFAAAPDQVREIVNRYELLAQQDNYFNVALNGQTAVVVDPAPPGARLKPPAAPAAQPPSQPKTTFAAAAYLFPEGAQLFELTQSSVPIMRLDEWVAFTFSSVNGGKYYELAGIEKSLEDTIHKFAGQEAAQKVIKFSETLRRSAAEHKATQEPIAQIASRLDPELAKTKAYIQASGVTGRQRLVVFVYGTATAPASGPQLVAVTFDIGEDNLDPNSDPLRAPTTYERYDGGEAIFALPNGLLAYLVFNAQDKTIASVPDNVAHDFAAREVRSNVATVRVFSGLSCAHCHDRRASNWGWQSVVNDLYRDDRLTQLVDDRAQQDQVRALQVASSQFGASNEDLRNVLAPARQSYQYRAQLATGQKTTRQTVAGLADSYWGYWYDSVTPQLAARDLGQMLEPAAAQLFLLRAIEPHEHAAGLVLREDAVLARLKDGQSVTPVQWRSGFQSFAERANFHKEN
jgi:hypothetical protein